MKELEIFPNYPIKLEQKYAQRKNFLNFIKKIIFDNNIYIENKENDETKIYDVIKEIENGNFLFKKNKYRYELVGVNSHYEKILNNSENSLAYNYHHISRINQVQEVIDIYKNYSTLIKSSKNVPEADIRYFDFYGCGSAEEVYDGFQRIKHLNNVRKFANKYLRSYKDFLYKKNDNNEEIIDESVLRLFEVLEKQYKAGKLSSDEIKQDIRKVKGFDKNDLKETLKKIASKNNLTAEKIINKIDEENLDADIISNADNRLYIKINDFEASQKLGSGQWCISTDDGYYEDYLMEDDTQFKGKHIFCYDFSKPPEDALSLFAFTINAKGKVSAAHDKNDENIMDNIISIINNNSDENDQGKLLEIVKKTITPPDEQYRENKEYLNDESVNHDYYAENICYPLVFFNEANENCHHLPALTADVIEETLKDHKKFSIYSDDYIIENLRGVAIHLKTQSYNVPDDVDVIETCFTLCGEMYDEVDEIPEEDLDYIYDTLGYKKQEYKLNDFFFDTIGINDVFKNSSLHYKNRLSNYIFENYREDFENGLKKELIGSSFSIHLNKIKTITDDTIASNIASRYYQKYKDQISNDIEKIIINTMVKNNEFDEGILDRFIELNVKKENFNLTTTIDFIKDLDSDTAKSYLIKKIPYENFTTRVRPETIMDIINDDVLLDSLSEKQKLSIRKSTDIDCKSYSSDWSITSDTGNPNRETVFDLHERIKKIYDNKLMSLESIKNSLDDIRITFGDKPKLKEVLKELEEKEKINKDVKNTLNKIKNSKKGLKNT